MPKRGRRVGAYAPRPQTVYQTVDEFVAGTLTSGVHTIRSGKLVADVLYEDRGDGPLLVFFSSVVGESTTWPYFSGVGIAARTDASLLAFSDPSIAIGAPTGWTLGDFRSRFHEEVPRIIDAVAGGRRVILAGVSAGGFPALHYGASLPGAVSIVVNPRTNLLTPPTSVQNWAHVLYATTDPRRVRELVPLKPDSPQNRVIYLQNAGDHRYFGAHMIPYLMRLPREADVWTLVEDWGEGHVPPPRGLLAELIAEIMVDPSAAAGTSRFESVDELLAHQAALNFAKYVR